MIAKSTIGIAAKDLSIVEGDTMAFCKNKTAIALYQKKPLFGPGTATFTNSLFLNHQIFSEIEKESHLNLRLVGSDRLSSHSGLLQDQTFEGTREMLSAIPVLQPAFSIMGNICN